MSVAQLAGYANDLVEALTVIGQFGFMAAAWRLSKKVDARQTAHEAKHAEHVDQDSAFQAEVRNHLGLPQPSVH